MRSKLSHNMRVDKTPTKAKRRNKTMARNMVTRTVKGTEVTAKVVDASTEQIVAHTLTLAKSFTSTNEAGETVVDSDKLKKAVTKALPDGLILVSIAETKEINKCYGVPVAKFMELAVELDPATRSKLDAADDAAETEAE